MPSNNSKYTPEFREETAKYIIESGGSATGMAGEIGRDALSTTLVRKAFS